ncbi:hypothetical protein JVT61DRAFT_10561 [Boletus reticuloceps]|uniref:EXS domain-containing protein n=1 Tax=Boletus reticuloceps TaxID=495285 RepID=A0A8I2Z0E2_9AGAM|nr:hypothetical protein JVT61DRAFT_10561 [Boletus reticuloceps]
MRRYRDSNLPTHLIKAGKYAMGMEHYFFYYYWRHQDMPHIGANFIVWCFTGVVYGLYACAWFYYFALISNLCIRFFWVIYIPIHAPNITVRTFILATFEMLRRVQWNFYRLENEHLGNIDQYRVTRELPLPYSFDAHSNEEEHEEEDAPSPSCQRIVVVELTNGAFEAKPRPRLGWLMLKRWWVALAASSNGTHVDHSLPVLLWCYLPGATHAEIHIY